MAFLKRLLQNMYGLSRTETNGFMVLLPLMALIIFSEPLYSWWIGTREDDFSNEKAMLDSLTNQWELEKKKTNSPPAQNTTKPHTFFFFNPNSAPQEDLSALGFSGPVASRIIHYRQKGGKFKIKSDLLKIYGMDPRLYAKLRTFIQLPDEQESKSSLKGGFVFKSAPKKEIFKFDLNVADTAQLKKIYGIGTKLAARIVKYRESLGGFVVYTQVTEVYGLDSMVINQLLKFSYIDAHFQQKKININTATENELDAHPYITRNIAKAITAYRFQHGNFKEAGEIRKLQVVKEDIAGKIIPYLSVE